MSFRKCTIQNMSTAKLLITSVAVVKHDGYCKNQESGKNYRNTIQYNKNVVSPTSATTEEQSKRKYYSQH